MNRKNLEKVAIGAVLALYVLMRIGLRRQFTGQPWGLIGLAFIVCAIALAVYFGWRFIRRSKDV
jgi:hypothetical protein